MHAECKSTATDSQFIEVKILKFLQILNWSPAVNRQPRFRGEGLVEHCGAKHFLA